MKRLDRLDQKILSILQTEGRLSNVELAARVGLSPTPCARRVRILEESGAIARYSAVVDLGKVGLGMVVFASVRLSSHQLQVLEDFERAVREMPEVLDAYMVTGSSEYLLKIAARDLPSYNDFQRQKILSMPYVTQLDSVFVLKQSKSSATLTDARAH